MSDEPVRTTRDRIDWQRMADNQPPLTVWVEAKTDLPQAEMHIVRRVGGGGFEFSGGPIIPKHLCLLTQWRYI